MPALRLKNIYLAIATLGFGVVLQKIIFEWRSLTGGGGGLALAAPSIAGYEIGATGLYYLTLRLHDASACSAPGMSAAAAPAARCSSSRTARSPPDRSGFTPPRYKVTAFAISAFYAAIAGGLFAYLVRYINPESFSVGLSISFLSMVVIGGLGTIGGSIVGAMFYVIVPELLRGIKDAPGLVFGLLLVVVMVFMPQGLWGMMRRLGAEILTMTRLAIEDVSVDFGGIHALTRRQLRAGGRLDRRADRPERRRQEHAAQLHLRHHAADPRAASGSTTPCSRPCRRRAWRATASAGCSSIRNWSPTSRCMTIFWSPATARSITA